mmetsp:Transcript_41490/g.56570  ORF Transcript_41490/g.56570 Transcript_41490/m.56570 type:complete len:80 (-) Transcript_41490:77-316(-)
MQLDCTKEEILNSGIFAPRSEHFDPTIATMSKICHNKHSKMKIHLATINAGMIETNDRDHEKGNYVCEHLSGRSSISEV